MSCKEMMEVQQMLGLHWNCSKWK